MMNDAELLDLAAKAYARPQIRKVNFGAWCDFEREAYWNPLADDGDALRLAVELNISVFPPAGGDGDFAVASIEAGVLSDDGDTWIQEWVTNGDKMAATRRAIVRAATEIAKVKNNPLPPGD